MGQKRTGQYCYCNINKDKNVHRCAVREEKMREKCCFLASRHKRFLKRGPSVSITPNCMTCRDTAYLKNE